MENLRQTEKDDLRAEYERSDFLNGFIRGKYAKRMQESSNIVVPKPELPTFSRMKKP